MKISNLIEGSRLPVLVEPADGPRNLKKFTLQNRNEIEDQLTESGAILFRGFTVSSSSDFDKFVGAVSSHKMDYVYGSTPRTQLKQGIYTATEYPPNREIPLHSEVAYFTDWPQKIALCCLTPADERGETPLADLQLVNESVGDEIVHEFSERKVKYVRHYHPYVDVPWQQVFETEDKSDVARFCADNGIEIEWLEDDILRTVQICQGTSRHPILEQDFLFNQAHLYHVSSLDQKEADSLINIFGHDRLPRNAFFGDGGEIPLSTLETVRRAYSENAVDFSWEAGDVLLVDNMQVAHGRRTFAGPRKVLAALMDPYSARYRDSSDAKPWWKRW